MRSHENKAAGSHKKLASRASPFTGSYIMREREKQRESEDERERARERDGGRRWRSVAVGASLLL